LPGRWPLLFTIGAFGAVACGVRAPDPGGITIAVDGDPVSLDPRLGSDEASRRFQDLVFNSLARTGDDARPVPDLASAIDRPDPLTVVVTLRSGVTFHDGSLLSSRDVRETYLSILEGDVPSFRRGDLEMFASVEAPDPETVVFRLRRPFAPAISNLTVPILRAGSGPEAARHPIGTGPFRLARRRKDEDLLLERFDGYFEGPASIRSVRLRVIPSETARLLEVLTGGVDFILNDLPPDGVERVRRAAGFRVLARPGRNAVYMAFNMRDPILREARVREAIACALDREAIVRHLLRGSATLATGLLPPGHWAYNAAVATAAHDAARARRLLDEAGYPDPDGPGPAVRFRLEYKAPSSDLARQQAAALQAQLLEAGIGVDVRTYEWATFYEDLRAGRFQVVVSNWTDLSDPDVYRLRFHSAAAPPAGLNRGGYANPEADRLIDSGAAETDIETRRALYGRLQEILATDRPYVVLWHRHVTAVLGPRIAAFDLLSGGDFRPLWRLRLAGAGGMTPPRGGEEPADSGEPAAEGGLEGAGGDCPRSDEPRRVDGEVEDGRGVASGGRPAVEDRPDVVVERLGGLLRRRGRRLAGSVGAGRDDRPAHGARQRGRHGMGGDPDADRVSAAEKARRQVVGGQEDQSERSRPEGVHQAPGALRNVAGAEDDRVAPAGDERQGHAVGASLCLEDPVDRRRVARVARQPVEGLRRVDHEAALLEDFRGLGDRGGIRFLRIEAGHLGGHCTLALRRGGVPTISQPTGTGGDHSRERGPGQRLPQEIPA
jgi:peptide/nickel transport system substrate-binding protein